MQSGEYLGQENFQIAIGPARVAYLVRHGSEDGYKRAIQEACKRWGGVTEPIIPVSDDGEIDDRWRDVLEFAEVDELVDVDCSTGSAQAISGLLGSPLESIVNIDSAGPGRFTCHPLIVSQEDQQSASSSMGYFGEPGAIRNSRYYAESTRDSETLWAITAAGTFASDSAGSQGWIVPMSPDQSYGFMSYPTVLDRSTSQFGQYWSEGGPQPSPAIFWLCGKDHPLQDCLSYWNFRALRPFGPEYIPMFLLPVEEVGNWLELKKRVHEVLCSRFGGFPVDAILYSHEVQPDQLHEIARSWDLVEDASDPPKGLSVSRLAPRTQPFTYRIDIDPMTYMYWHRRYGVTTRVPIQVFRDKTSVAFNSPVHFAGQGFLKLNVASDVLSPFPRRASVALLIQPESRWHNDGIELYQPALSNYEIDICVPQLSEVVETLLAEATDSHCLSDKGRMGQSITPSRKLDRLLDPGVFEAIRSLTTPRKEHVVETLKERVSTGTQPDYRRLASEFGRLERKSQCASELMNPKRQITVSSIEALVGLGWAERGCRIVCNRCSVTSFVLFRDTTPSASCPGCESSEQYDSSPTGITTYYRLNSLIDLASDQGVLPHLLAIAALRKGSSDTFILPGVDVTFDNGTKREVDLFGVHGGKVIAGEVKTSAAEFTEEQIGRDIELSKLLLADVHVMACTEALNEEVKSTANQIAQRCEVDLQILDATLLRPSS